MQKTAKTNISEKFSWVAKNLKPNPENTVLILEPGISQLNYALFTKNKELLSLKSLQNNELNPGPESIARFIASDEFLQHSYSKVLVSASETIYTLVPKAFYQEENKSTFLDFNAKSKKEAVFYADVPAHLDTCVVYAIDGKLKGNLDKYFPNHQIKSSVATILESAVHDNNVSQTVFLNFRKDAVDILLFNRKLMFCNSFAVLSPEDLLYFVLSSIENNSFAPLSLRLIITGETETNAMSVKLLKKYIKKVEFAQIEKQFSKPMQIDGIGSHYYYHLLNRINCE